MSAIRIEDLTLGYEGHPAVHHLDGVFEQGSLTAIMGPNGSGKSTLLKGIIGAVKPLGGRVVLDKLNWRDIAYLPQSADCADPRGWQYDDPANPKHIRLCGAICDEVLGTQTGKIDVVLGCETYVSPVN
ncbi:MAG: ATP-binding cassette domain-containing protein [Rhizobiaceae bacterium]|nr:MAG: ATP-binding cassette domain-containing protein [Rhizobiaceae bacterium]